MPEKIDVMEALYEKAERNGLTLSVHFELTYRCNIKCKHCYIRGDLNNEVSTDEAKKILDNLAESGVLFVTFTGGEPLLRKDFLEIVRHAKKNTFSIRIFTNGTLIDEAMADQLCEIAPQEVGISLYAARPSTHDAITGIDGSFKKTVKGIRLISERGIRTVVKSVIMKPNFDEYAEIIELARSFGATYMFDPTVFPGDDGDKTPLELRLDDEQLKAVMSDPLLMSGRPGTSARGTCRGPICSLNCVNLGISPLGEVYPCLQLRWSYGNLKYDKLPQIVDKIRGCDHIRRLVDFEGLVDCGKECAIINYCSRCPGLALLEDGDAFGRSEWACRIARIVHEEKKLAFRKH